MKRNTVPGRGLDGVAVRTAVAVVLLTVIAAALRMQALQLGPQGLYRDEAQNGLDALTVLGGARPIFFEANNGREPLYIYLAALSIGLLGRSPGALRLVSVVAGTLTVPALYWLGHELFGRRTGLWAAALAVSTVWLLNLSRVAFRAVLLPLVGALALAATWRALRLRSPAWAIVGGLLLGLCQYTYLAARAIPLALGLVLVWCALDARTRSETWWGGWAIAIGVSLVVSAPLMIYLVKTGALWSRSGQVSILNPAINQGDLLGTLAQSAFRTVRSLAYAGDFIPRHNVPLRPVYTLPIAALAYVGLALLIFRARHQVPARLVLVWLVVLAAPTVLAEDAPHFLRGAGALTAIALLPALGLDALQTRLDGKWRWIGWAAALIAVGWSAADDWQAYAAHLASEAAYYEFEAGATELAVEINRYEGCGWQGQGVRVAACDPVQGREVWVEKRLWDGFPSLAYLVPAAGRVQLLEEGAAAPPASGESVLAALWPHVDHRAVWETLPPRWQWELSPGAWERGDLDPEPRMLYLTLRGAPAGELVSTEGARFEDGLALLGARAEASDDRRTLQVAIWWRADGEPAQGYSGFVHAACDDRVVGQLDGPPAGTWFPTDAWRPGDVIVDRRSIPLDTAWDANACSLRLGLYRWQDGTRLEVIDPGPFTTQDNALFLTAQDLTWRE